MKGVTGKDGAGVSKSDYAQARLRNIERNRRVLKQLGVMVATHVSTAGAVGRVNKRRRITMARPPQRHTMLKAADGDSDPGMAPRRSRRLAALTSVDYKEDVLAAAGVEAPPSQDPLGANSEYVGLRLPEGVEASLGHWPGHAAATARGAKGSASVDHLPANSCRRLHLGVDRLLDAHLGRSIPPLRGSAMKAAAMLACCREGMVPRFSKMSGIQQWADGVALFVNVGGRDYKNMFLRSGRHLTWFAQRTQHPNSPVIARMLEHAPRASNSDIHPTGTSCAVVLFCRLPQEPYVFCGRLRYVSHDPAVRPMRFVWELQDLDAALRADGESNMAAIVSGSR